MVKSNAVPKMPEGWIDVSVPVRDGVVRWPTGEQDESPAATVGPARVVELRGGAASREELRRAGVRSGERLLLKPRGRGRSVRLQLDGASYLSERGVRAIGVHGAPTPETRASRDALLRTGAWTLEGLDLSQSHAGRYEMICVPLTIGKAGDAAPARVLLRRRGR